MRQAADADLRANRAEEKAEQLRAENGELLHRVAAIRQVLDECAPGLEDIENIEEFVPAPPGPRPPRDAIPTGSDVGTYRALTTNTVAFYERKLALVVMFDSAPLRDINYDKLVDLAEQIHPLMPNLRRYNIKGKGYTMGLGYTRKYEAGYPMKGYNIKPHLQGCGETLEEARPDLFRDVVKAAELLGRLLQQCCPQAFLARLNTTLQFQVPVLGASQTSCFYITHNFSTALHFDKDEGSALALALAVERHRPGCRRPGRTCKKNWYFIVDELRVKVPLQHAMLFIWDSRGRSHGTSCDGTVPGGCNSDVYVFVSQQKSSHYRECNQ